MLEEGDIVENGPPCRKLQVKRKLESEVILREEKVVFLIYIWCKKKKILVLFRYAKVRGRKRNKILNTFLGK